jgi:hypothetical protein
MHLCLSPHACATVSALEGQRADLYSWSGDETSQTSGHQCLSQSYTPSDLLLATDGCAFESGPSARGSGGRKSSTRFLDRVLAQESVSFSIFEAPLLYVIDPITQS